jgi:hypothetical protein
MPPRHVEFDADTIRVLADSKVLWSIPWARIDKVLACKADLFAVDLLVIQLIDSTDLAYDVDEEMANYDRFLTELTARFPGIREDWWRDVALPAFATNPTELWRKKP